MIYDYERKPPVKFYGKHPSKLFFGMELELEAQGGFCGSLYDVAAGINNQFMFCKYDCSIRNGFELVTQPFTLMYYKNDTAGHFKKILGLASDMDPDSNQGIHIHYNKEAFAGQQHIYKNLMFFCNYRRFIRLISGRSLDRFKHWTPIGWGPKTAKKAAEDGTKGGRDAFTLYHDSKTIEMRIFKSTLDPSLLGKNIEFAHALYYFTKLYGIKRMQPKYFRRFVKQRESKYSNLQKFLEGLQAEELIPTP